MTKPMQERFKGGSLFRFCLWRLNCLIGRGVCWAGCSLALLFYLAGPAHSQLAATCSDSSLRELEKAIENHNEHAYKLNKKFKDIWYPQGPIPAEVRKAISLQDILRYLTALGERKSAVLFHEVERGYLRSWLITYRGKIICASPRMLTQDDWKLLQPGSWNFIGARGAKRVRTATPLDISEQGLADQDRKWSAILLRLADILLPHGVAEEFEASKIDTLVVVPITVREFNPSVDEEETSATHVKEGRSTLKVPSIRAVLSIGVVPFAALPIGDDVLIHKMSVIISPGFFTFAQSPQPSREKYSNPIIVGNPQLKGFQALPGAEQEAKSIAEILHTEKIFLNGKATKAVLESFLRDRASEVDFIHLATHGIADAENPVDESYLIFSDGPWNARQISRLRRPALSVPKGKRDEEDLPLLEAKPLVIMSACQTGLGKDFPAGTIGLARAWHWAGASNVVMSLWSVDDEATKELMENFVRLVCIGQAVDKAIQSAMLSLRCKYPNPYFWASFSVYGAPERLRSISKQIDRKQAVLFSP